MEEVRGASPWRGSDRRWSALALPASPEASLCSAPGLDRYRLQELVVGAVDLVHHMCAGQDAVERDAASQRAFAHIDAFPMDPATSPEGDFQINAAVAGAHDIGTGYCRYICKDEE